MVVWSFFIKEKAKAVKIIEENVITYNISKHAEERYVSRVIGKEDTNAINCFIVENKEKIKTDINKLIHYGSCIYTGKQSQKDGKGKVLNVYIKEPWCLLVDAKAAIAVTVYKIDLKCNDEVNKLYISGMLENLNEAKEHLLSVQREVDEENNMYNEMISDAEIQIKEYKTMIKNLEALRDSYQGIIHNNIVKVSQADREVADIVNTLISKKEF